MRSSGVWQRIGLGAFVLVALGPIAWATLSAFLPTVALTSLPPDLSPGNLTLANFREVLSNTRDLGQGLRNSAIVASATALVSLGVGSTAAYALSRLGLPGAGRILLVILATQMFPAIVLVIPLFILLARLDLIDSLTGLSFVYLSFTLPVVIWVLKGFFDALPPELERAAQVDGAGPFTAFRLVVLPLSLPALFAAGVFAFIEAWNEFFFAVILTRISSKTAPVAIAEFSGQYQTLYGQMVAAAVLASLPVVALAIVFRRQIVKGFVEGAVKG